MGQYHAPINLDRQQGYVPWRLSSGTKLTEQGYTMATCMALLRLVADPAKWAGNRIAIVGDYAEDADLPGAPVASTIWHRLNEPTESGWTNIGDEIAADLEHHRLITQDIDTYTVTNAVTRETTHRVQYVVEPATSALDASDATRGNPSGMVLRNYTKQQTITPDLLGDGPTIESMSWPGGGTGTALHLLLAVSNGRGGGDFRNDSRLIGSWGGDQIALVETSDHADSGWEDITAAVRALLDGADDIEYDIAQDGRVTRRDLWIEGQRRKERHEASPESLGRLAALVDGDYEQLGATISGDDLAGWVDAAAEHVGTPRRDEYLAAARRFLVALGHAEEGVPPADAALGDVLRGVARSAEGGPWEFVVDSASAMAAWARSDWELRAMAAGLGDEARVVAERHSDWGLVAEERVAGYVHALFGGVGLYVRA